MLHSMHRTVWSQLQLFARVSVLAVLATAVKTSVPDVPREFCVIVEARQREMGQV